MKKGYSEEEKRGRKKCNSSASSHRRAAPRHDHCTPPATQSLAKPRPPRAPTRSLIFFIFCSGYNLQIFIVIIFCFLLPILISLRLLSVPLLSSVNMLRTEE
ncbi:hypothetical protein JHK87_030646 [Glycine soja]|nr:hypothetical protein JHK87_030646 [Glycine soja]KAG4994010.1 hypothetical protein JHK86_030837 [Glycine max]